MKIKGGAKRVLKMISEGWSLPEEHTLRLRGTKQFKLFATMTKGNRTVCVRHRHALKALRFHFAKEEGS